MNDQYFMKRCFELALLGVGKVHPNPMVGAVIVYENKIIGEGYHQQFGGAHAEINAINNINMSNKRDLPKATLYVSLEPCFHYGKTPPCVEAVLKHHFERVVISCIDPNPKVAGKSIKKMRESGIVVKTGILEQEGKQLIQAFLQSLRTKKE